eukprot:g17330.t1
MSPLVIGLVAGLAVGAVVIFCCVRSVCKEKKAISRQVKQVQQVDEDPYFDDVEAPTPPSEQNTGRETKTGATKKASAKSPPPASAPVATAAKRQAPAAAMVVAPAHEAAPPSYDELEATAGTPPAAAAAAAVTSTPTHVYGDDSEDFQGRHEYQTSRDPYDAPVRVSKSTERRSGSLRQLSPEPVSRTSSISSSRGRSAVREAEAAASRVS